MKLPDLILKSSKHGKGVFAGKNFRRGEFIFKFTGKIHKIKDNPKGMNSKNSHYIQIGKDICLGPTKSFDNYINHSCNPNSGLKISDQVRLFATRKIRKGKEVTYDYSTTMYEDDWKMECRCGYGKCRRVVRDFKFLLRDVQQKYIKLGVVPQYVIENLKKINK